ncbi:MAG: hypothetical protein WCO78_04355 [Candidatus Roizmanbacteria bacterium]
MKGYVLWIGFISLALLFLINPQRVFAVRYASCDACGLCVNSDGTFKKNKAGEDVIPQGWPSCAKCLYTGVTWAPGDTLSDVVNANKDKTLKIIDVTITSVPPRTVPGTDPPQTISGKYFTQLGCFDIGSEFDNPNISSSFIGSLLSIIQSVTGAVGFLYLLYGAFLVLTSRGDVVKLKSGQQAVIWAIIGTIFTILAVFVVRFVAVDLLRIPGIQ